MVQPNVCKVLVREECHTDLAMLVMEEGIFFFSRIGFAVNRTPSKKSLGS